MMLFTVTAGFIGMHASAQLQVLGAEGIGGRQDQVLQFQARI